MEMQIKATLSFHLIPVRIESRRQLTNAAGDTGVGKPSFTLVGIANWYSNHGNQDRKALKS